MNMINNMTNRLLIKASVTQLHGWENTAGSAMSMRQSLNASESVHPLTRQSI